MSEGTPNTVTTEQAAPKNPEQSPTRSDKPITPIHVKPAER